MPFRKGKYCYWLVRPLLFVVYVSFFMVQLFCITGPDSAAMISPSASVLSFYKINTKRDKGDHHLGVIKKTKLSINKRFQRSIGDLVLKMADDLPVRYEGSVHFTAHKDYLLLSVILAESLRGPPATV